MFSSFFLAGFEGATGYNVRNEWFDQVVATEHDRFLEEDYSRLVDLGIHAVRDTVRWPLVDRRGRYDFVTVIPLVRAARKYQVEIIYDLFHFGFPPEVDLFSDSFPERFAEYCYAVARFISGETEGPWYFTPVNEPSYFSWAAGETALFAPHQHGRGFELKVQLVRAAIQGIDAIRSVSPGARIVNVDPICRVAAPFGRPDLDGEVQEFNRNVVFQSWDMLSGRILPHLGGSPEHLDIVGVNYYWTNQWEIHNPGVHIGPADVRYCPVRKLLRTISERYRTDILITETSHVGDMRDKWLREVSEDAVRCVDTGVPLRGICLYPATSMPEWHARERWTHMGLWDLVPRDGRLQRIAYEPMHEALRNAREQLEGLQYLVPRMVN